MIHCYHVYWGPSRASIASEIHVSDDDKLSGIEFAVSFCSPKDMFVKKIGRNLAVSRLQNKDPKFYRKISVDYPGDINFYFIQYKIIDEIHASMDIPSWV